MAVDTIRSRRNGHAHEALRARAGDVVDDIAGLRKDVSRLAKAAKKSARYEMNHVGDRMHTLRDSFRDRASSGAEYVSERVRERPGAAVGLSLGAGLLLGLLLMRR